MTKQEYKNCKVGDGVICNTSYINLPQKGWKGKIIHKDISCGTILIEWEKPFIDGHDGSGKGEDKKCRWYSSSYYLLDLIKNQQLEFDFGARDC